MAEIWVATDHCSAHRRFGDFWGYRSDDAAVVIEGATVDAAVRRMKPHVARGAAAAEDRARRMWGRTTAAGSATTISSVRCCRRWDRAVFLGAKLLLPETGYGRSRFRLLASSLVDCMAWIDPDLRLWQHRRSFGRSRSPELLFVRNSPAAIPNEGDEAPNRCSGGVL
ncbi:hypothetical protein ACLOJK_019277 [Asimina triloba]